MSKKPKAGPAPAADKTDKFKVRAIAAGYYDGHLRSPATEKGPASVFYINSMAEFSKTWMELLSSGDKTVVVERSNPSKDSAKQAREEEKQRIADAIQALDSNDDSHWDGELPSPAAVSELVGYEVGSGDISSALQNYTRKDARVAATNI